MTHERLKHCILLAVYKEKIDNLSSIDVTDEFCFSSEGSRIFGLFAKTICILKFLPFELK